MISCTVELEKLKQIKLDADFSLYDFLRKDQNDIARHYSQNEKVKAILTDGNLKNDFPLYSYLLILKYERGIARSRMMTPAMHLLQSILNFSLPILCCERIVEYSSNENMRCWIEAESCIDSAKKRLDDDIMKSEISSSKRPKLE